MKAPKGCAAIAVIGFVVAAALAVGIGGAGGVGFWFIQGTFDRVNPLATQATAYARPPASDAYFDSYADATGSGENYVYEVHAYDENGVEHKANLISFGGKLEGGGSDLAAADYLKLSIKGSYVRHWEPVKADALPAAAAQALE